MFKFFAIFCAQNLAAGQSGCDESVFDGLPVIFRGARAKLQCPAGTVLAGTGTSKTKCAQTKYGEFFWKTEDLDDECISCVDIQFDDSNVLQAEGNKGKKKFRRLSCPSDAKLFRTSNSKKIINFFSFHYFSLILFYNL